jgi:hypothetical protein
MLEHGRIPMDETEAAAVEETLKKYAGLGQPSITRRDPGETGPLLVHFADRTFEIHGSRVRRAK